MKTIKVLDSIQFRKYDQFNREDILTIHSYLPNHIKRLLGKKVHYDRQLMYKIGKIKPLKNGSFEITNIHTTTFRSLYDNETGFKLELEFAMEDITVYPTAILSISYDEKSVAMHQLSSLGVGSHYCGWLKGYVNIKEVAQGYTVIWTTGKDSHNRIFGVSALSAHFTVKGASNVFKQAVNMWPVENEKEKKQCIQFLENKIDNAYNHLFRS